jgi:HlyD family secretion protein
MALQGRRFLGPALVGIIVVAGLVYAFWPRPVPVDLAVVARGPLSVTVDGDGRTRVREVYVVSAPVAGRVLRIERHVGDAVVAGETVLATIEPGDPAFLDRRGRRQAEAAVEAAAAAKLLAEAELTRGLAELEFARADLDRASRLAERGTISERALDSAKLEYHTRDAAAAAARAALDVRLHELETARAALIEPGEDGGDESEACCVDVRAPVSGRVLTLVQESEAVVAGGAPLVEIGDPRDLEIVVDLLSSDAVKVGEGAPVRIEGWGGEGMLEGRVRRVEPTGFTKASRSSGST